VSVGKSILAKAHTKLLGSLFHIESFGLENIPAQQQLLIAANHSSHLDYGILKAALSHQILGISALAAADYFFDRSWKRRLLLPLTDLVPVMRQGSFSLALKGAETAMTNGRSLLIFPEGTRGYSKELQSFRPGVGYLQRRAQIPILPVYIEGTSDILPKGQTIPKGRRVQIFVGAPLRNEMLDGLVQGMRPSEAYVRIATETRNRIQTLQTQAKA
jgi:1-acyl-sn-glycerol-3-phosphate acyltransferase